MADHARLLANGHDNIMATIVFARNIQHGKSRITDDNFPRICVIKIEK